MTDFTQSARSGRTFAAVGFMPGMVDARKPQLSRFALDHDAALYIVEQSHPFRVEGMHAHEVLARKQRQARERQFEPEALLVDAPWRDAVHVGGDAVDGRAVGAH